MQSINHRARWTAEPTFGILVPTLRGFGTPAGVPCCCHASFPSGFIRGERSDREPRGVCHAK